MGVRLRKVPSARSGTLTAGRGARTAPEQPAGGYRVPLDRADLSRAILAILAKMALVVAETLTAARPGLLDIDELGALEQQGQQRGRRVWGRLMDLMLAPQAAEDPRPQRCATCGGRLCRTERHRRTDGDGGGGRRPRASGGGLACDAGRHGGPPGTGADGRPGNGAHASGLGTPAIHTVVVRGAGAAWIWPRAAQFLGGPGVDVVDVVEIVDLYHAYEYWWAVGDARWGAGTPQAATWVEPLKDQLYAHGAPAVLAARAALTPAPATPAEAEASATAQHYFRTHAARLDYPRCVARQFPLGSGAGESSCQCLVEARAKEAGMRWSTAGVQHVAARRALHALACPAPLRPLGDLLAGPAASRHSPIAPVLPLPPPPRRPCAACSAAARTPPAPGSCTAPTPTPSSPAQPDGELS